MSRARELVTSIEFACYDIIVLKIFSVGTPEGGHNIAE